MKIVHFAQNLLTEDEVRAILGKGPNNACELGQLKFFGHLL